MEQTSQLQHVNTQTEPARGWGGEGGRAARGATVGEAGAGRGVGGGRGGGGGGERVQTARG